MSGRPFVSVIIPVYKNTRYLKQTLTSLAGQTIFPLGKYSLEAILAQAGSDEDLSPFIPDEIRGLVSQLTVEHLGVSHTRNVAISKARSNWLAFLDADDNWLPQKLEKQLDYIAQTPAVEMLYTNSFWIDATGDRFKKTQLDEYGKMPEGKIADILLERNYIITSSVLLKKDLFERLGGFDTELEVSEDWDLWIRAARSSWIGVLSEPLIEYRLHPEGTHYQLDKMLKCAMKIMDKNFQISREENAGFLTETHAQRFRKLKGNMHVILAGSAIYNNQADLCRKFLYEAMTYSKFNLRLYLFFLLSIFPVSVRRFLIRLRDILPFLNKI